MYFNTKFLFLLSRLRLCSNFVLQLLDGFIEFLAMRTGFATLCNYECMIVYVCSYMCIFNHNSCDDKWCVYISCGFHTWSPLPSGNQTWPWPRKMEYLSVMFPLKPPFIVIGDLPLPCLMTPEGSWTAYNGTSSSNGWNLEVASDEICSSPGLAKFQTCRVGKFKHWHINKGKPSVNGAVFPWHP